MYLAVRVDGGGGISILLHGETLEEAKREFAATDEDERMNSDAIYDLFGVDTSDASEDEVHATLEGFGARYVVALDGHVCVGPDATPGVLVGSWSLWELPED